MAEAQPGSAKQIRKIQELFHGRFSESEIRALLRQHHGISEEVIGFVFSSEPHEVRQAIGTDSHSIENLEARCSDGVTRANDWADEWAEVGRDGKHIPRTVRQFTCQQCDNMWWRKVPRRKLVSKCRRCQLPFEALERNEEWGWAEFVCECGKTFWGSCQRANSSPCHVCGILVMPRRVIPPNSRGLPRLDRGRQRMDRHRCNAPDCFARAANPGRGAASATSDPVFNTAGRKVPITCVHPRSRAGKSFVVVAGNAHAPSGSTVDTCLTQDDLDDMISVIDDIRTYKETRSLPTIDENQPSGGHSDSDGDI